MMTHTIHSNSNEKRPIADVKADFAQCLRQVESGDSIVLTRHGKAVAALVSIQYFEQLERLIAAGPGSGLASVAGGWKGSKEVAEKAQEYGRSPAGGVPELD